jgi:hypothetical protein
MGADEAAASLVNTYSHPGRADDDASRGSRRRAL